MTLAFFCLSALDLLGDVLNDEKRIPPEEKQAYRDWIWAQQMVNSNDAVSGTSSTREQTSLGGFRASPCTPLSISSGHLAMTYTALLCLALLRDDFTRLERASLKRLLTALQQPDGSFAPAVGQPECDPRFTFCAFAVCWMLDDWEAIDVEKAMRFLDSCKAYDGAYGQGPNQESHGGSTYCVVSSFGLAGRRCDEEDRRRLIGWLLARQSQHDEEEEEETDDEDDGASAHSKEPAGTHTPMGAFNGRINKPGDSCYSFWCGASLDVSQLAMTFHQAVRLGTEVLISSDRPLQILSSHHLICAKQNVVHLLLLQTPLGGVLKNDDQPHPDAMHSYLSLAALSLHSSGITENDDGWRQRCGISPLLSTRGRLDPRLNVSGDTVRWIMSHLHGRVAS